MGLQRYQLGCYADFQGFCLTLIEITNKDEIKICDEICSKASLVKIGEGINVFERQFGLFEIYTNTLKPLELYLNKIAKFHRCLPLDIASSIFLIACLCNDERLIIRENLKTSYLEDLASFDFETTSHRLNALALALGDVEWTSMLGT